MNAILSDRDVPCIDAGLVERANQTVARLKQLGLSVVTAESCTAGLIAALLSQAEDAGEVLHGSFVVYSKAHKTSALNIDPDLLRRQGAVNQAVAAQMLAGALGHSPASLALAVTGVLGPDPDEDGNPVGLVYLAAEQRGGRRRIIQRDYDRQPPDVLRRRVVLDALDLLDQLI